MIRKNQNWIYAKADDCQGLIFTVIQANIGDVIAWSFPVEDMENTVGGFGWRGSLTDFMKTFHPVE